jgi:hypothetical protein
LQSNKNENMAQMYYYKSPVLFLLGMLSRTKNRKF